MATVEKNDSIVVMKFNTCETVDIQITDSEGTEILLLDKDVRFLFMLLSKWLVEEMEAV